VSGFVGLRCWLVPLLGCLLGSGQWVVRVLFFFLCLLFLLFFVGRMWDGWLWGFGFGADVYLWASLEVWRMWDGRWGGMIGGWRMADDRWGGWRMWDEYLVWMIGRVGKP